jgi:hypothetical protein
MAKYVHFLAYNWDTLIRRCFILLDFIWSFLSFLKSYYLVYFCTLYDFFFFKKNSNMEYILSRKRNKVSKSVCMSPTPLFRPNPRRSLVYDDCGRKRQRNTSILMSYSILGFQTPIVNIVFFQPWPCFQTSCLHPILLYRQSDQFHQGIARQRTRDESWQSQERQLDICLCRCTRPWYGHSFYELT